MHAFRSSSPSLSPSSLRLTAMFVFGASVALMGCGRDTLVDGDGGTGGGSAGSGGSSSSSNSGGSNTGGNGSGGGTSGDWMTLIEGDWSLPSGSEGYYCVIATVPEDMFVQRFRPVAPLGTHHTVLTRTSIGEEGVFPCDAGTNGQNMVYGSGVGTEELQFPDGVAVRFNKGEKLLLNLHVYNASSESLSGLSGIEVKTRPAAEVDYEAESVLAGPLGLNIPPQSETTETGYCTLPADTTLFAVGPHMHQLGNHMKVTAHLGDGPQVIHDEAYTFDDQRHIPLAPLVQLKGGDSIQVDCTYNNPTDQTVHWGDSSDQEMCFAGLYMFPATGQSFICTN